MENNELLACPCCGERPRLVDVAGWEIICKCGLSFCSEPDKTACIAGWNRRIREAGQGEAVCWITEESLGWLGEMQKYGPTIAFPKKHGNYTVPLYTRPQPEQASVCTDCGHIPHLDGCSALFRKPEQAAQRQENAALLAEQQIVKDLSAALEIKNASIQALIIQRDDEKAAHQETIAEWNAERKVLMQRIEELGGSDAV